MIDCPDTVDVLLALWAEFPPPECPYCEGCGVDWSQPLAPVPCPHCEASGVA